jgi:hypothetical protein
MDESDDDEEAALEEQQWLLESSLPLVFEAYDEAVARDVADPVVILLDCEDAMGGEIARSWLGDEAVDDAIAEESQYEEAGDATTVFAFAYALAECRSELPPVFPYLAPALEQPPAGGFLAVSVTSGGASVLIVPLDARPE